MSNGRTTESSPVGGPEAIQLLERAQTLLETALEENEPEEKDYAIRRALQYIVALEYLHGMERS